MLGGPRGRLVTDKQLFDIQFAYAPDAPPQITIQQKLYLGQLHRRLLSLLEEPLGVIDRLRGGLKACEHLGNPRRPMRAHRV
jgi:hypothetical protein